MHTLPDSTMSLEEANCLLQQGLTGLLGIEITTISAEYVEATMMAGAQTLRPGGSIHGGVNLVLAETLAGVGSLSLIDNHRYDALGIQVSANHTAGARQGRLTVQASLFHHGQKTHIWDVVVMDERERCLSSVRVTNMIVERQALEGAEK